MEKTKVFISWSQDRSKYIAETVKWWLKQVVQASDPWVSSNDIDAGTRSMKEIETSLANTKFGIICVTPENVERPWLNYEAGALSKQVDEVENRVVPLLFGFTDKADITTPVGQFHAVLADKDGFEQIAQSLNKSLAVEMQRSTEDVRSSHEAFWAQLESRLDNVPVPTSKIEAPSRSTDDMIRELVNTVRDLDSKIERIMFSESDSAVSNRLNRHDLRAIEYFDAQRRAKSKFKDPDEEAKIRDLVRGLMPPDLNPRRVSVDVKGGQITIGTHRDLSEDECGEIVHQLFNALDAQYKIAFRNHRLTHVAGDDD